MRQTTQSIVSPILVHLPRLLHRVADLQSKTLDIATKEALLEFTKYLRRQLMRPSTAVGSIQDTLEIFLASEYSTTEMTCQLPYKEDTELAAFATVCAAFLIITRRILTVLDPDSAMDLDPSTRNDADDEIQKLSFFLAETLTRLIAQIPSATAFVLLVLDAAFAAINCIDHAGSLQDIVPGMPVMSLSPGKG